MNAQARHTSEHLTQARGCVRFTPSTAKFGAVSGNRSDRNDRAAVSQTYRICRGRKSGVVGHRASSCRQIMQGSEAAGAVSGKSGVVVKQSSLISMKSRYAIKATRHLSYLQRALSQTFGASTFFFRGVSEDFGACPF